MSASLVGSEMCIRDRPTPPLGGAGKPQLPSPLPPWARCPRRPGCWGPQLPRRGASPSVQTQGSPAAAGGSIAPPAPRGRPAT
eukprot:10542428-Alexandrium_andersonii.AAC.1